MRNTLSLEYSFTKTSAAFSPIVSLEKLIFRNLLSGLLKNAFSALRSFAKMLIYKGKLRF